MPNPDFTGNVPHKRCDTCKSWNRVIAGAADTHFGQCEWVPNEHLRTDRQPIGYPGHLSVTTTDLTVCSNWTAKTAE